MMAEPFEEDDRAVELSSIAAIYPEIRIDPSTPFKASLLLPVVPSTPIHVSFQPLRDGETPAILTPPTSVDTGDIGDRGAGKDEARTPGGAVGDVYTLAYLPPLNLEIELPQGYPSEVPPIFKLSADPPWLPSSHIARLLDDGRRLWEESGRDLVVYTYIDHLQQLSEGAFAVCDTPDGNMLLPWALKIALLDFNNNAEKRKFEQETFECGVCLEPKKGSNCHRLLLCSHVFCIPCLQDFYKSSIQEGDVDSVKCLAPDCGKDAEQGPVSNGAVAVLPKRKQQNRTLSPSELLQIPLDQETVQRYVFLKRKKKLEADKTTIYCPRKWCQGPARSKRHPKPVDPMNDELELSDDEDQRGVPFDPLGEESQLPPMPDRVAICEDCNYAFCSVCKKGWHGELVRCFPRRQAELSAEEKATEEYLKMYTTPCPTCNAPCQKRMGCNHMKCFKCDTHFCYLCSSWLSEANPYRHFNDIDSNCYNRLWDLEGGDGLDPEGAEALHQIPDALLEFDDDPVRQENDDDDDDDDGREWEFNDSGDEADAAWRRPQAPRPPPPPAPAPPRVNPQFPPERRRPANDNHEHNGNVNGAHDAAGRAAAAERQAQARAMAEIGNGHGRDGVGAAPPPPPPPPLQQQQQQQQRRPVRNADAQQALQRFLDLVQNDREDEWDSDEFDDDDL